MADLAPHGAVEEPPGVPAAQPPEVVLGPPLAEALVLTIAGGLTGIALGVGASWTLSASLGWVTAVSSQAIALAFGCALSIGAFFGWVPARRAAALNPIEALRYE